MMSHDGAATLPLRVETLFIHKVNTRYGLAYLSRWSCVETPTASSSPAENSSRNRSVSALLDICVTGGRGSHAGSDLSLSGDGSPIPSSASLSTNSRSFMTKFRPDTPSPESLVPSPITFHVACKATAGNLSGICSKTPPLWRGFSLDCQRPTTWFPC